MDSMHDGLGAQVQTHLCIRDAETKVVLFEKSYLPQKQIVAKVEEIKKEEHEQERPD